MNLRNKQPKRYYSDEEEEEEEDSDEYILDKPEKKTTNKKKIKRKQFERVKFPEQPKLQKCNIEHYDRYQSHLDDWKRSILKAVANVPTENLSNNQIEFFLDAFGVVKTGPRYLLVYRMNRLRSGQIAVRAHGKIPGVSFRKIQFATFIHAPRYEGIFYLITVSALKDVMRHIMIPMLTFSDVCALMKTCKQMYAFFHARAVEMAKDQLGQFGTPKALHLMHLIEQRKNFKLDEHFLTTWRKRLCIPKDKDKFWYMDVEHLCTKRFDTVGYIDHLNDGWRDIEARDQKAKYEEEQFSYQHLCRKMALFNAENPKAVHVTVTPSLTFEFQHPCVWKYLQYDETVHSFQDDIRRFIKSEMDVDMIHFPASVVYMAEIWYQVHPKYAQKKYFTPFIQCMKRLKMHGWYYTAHQLQVMLNRIDNQLSDQRRNVFIYFSYIDDEREKYYCSCENMDYATFAQRVFVCYPNFLEIEHHGHYEPNFYYAVIKEK